ncbi:MAG TPA: hypothetical protein VNE63_04425 [Candidatus Acidoferrales bacterium]|nr:hypothetical protein [Candidatus Acidoferrales bacterium]
MKTCIDGALCVGRLGVNPPLRLIPRKALFQIIKAVLILAILFSPTITWSQEQVTDQSNPLEFVQQSPTSQSNPAPAPPADSGAVSLPDKAPARQNNKDDSQGQQTKRMFWLVPNFGAVNANTQLPPLSTREKFVLASRDSVVDYSSFTWTAILAGQAMLLNSDPELGHGIAGYGRYYWRTFTDGVSGTFFTEAIVPTITHEDPRYYTMGEGGFFRRTDYAISRAFVTKTDSGGTSFNWSEVAGNGLEAALSNAYYPPQERGLSQTAVNWGTQMESAVLNHVFQEFWPDIRRKVFRQK